MSRLTNFHSKGGLALLLSLLVVSLLLAGSTAFGQEETGRVGVVVQFGDGSVETYYLELPTPVDRLTALEATGLTFETAFGGDAVCRIGEEGCPGNDTDCWCQCPFTPEEPCSFWIYLPINEAGDGWGDMNTWPLPELENGDVSAWVWGEVDVVASPWVPLVEPPFFTIDQIEANSSAGTAPSVMSYVGTIGVGAVAFVAVLVVLVIVYLLNKGGPER